jgi:hypothetical protein
MVPYWSTAIMKANPSVLLSLLHHRVYNSPAEWAPFDSHQFKQAWAHGRFDLQYCGKYCVVMHGVDYGKLVPWNKEAAERWDIVGYPRALLIIEAQALMISRLRAVVDLILQGVDHDTLGASDKWQEMVRAGFKQSNNIELWSDYVNQPFSAPPKFDVEHYCSVAEARMQAAQDHLWLLQTDPSYFRRFVKASAVGEVYRTAWRHVLVANDIIVAVEDYMIWRTLHAEWSCIQDYYRRYRDSIHPGQQLPRRLELNLAILETALLIVVDQRIEHLSTYIAQRPGFQHLWKWTILCTPPGILGEGMFDRERKTGYPPVYHGGDTLDWTLTELQGRPNDSACFDNQELFARLEAHLAEASSEERARLDGTVYEKMSDFAAKNEMLFALRLHRPAFARRGKEEAPEMLRENSTPCSRLLTRGTGIHKSKPADFPVGSLEIFEQLAPAAGRKNEAWLDCRTAERSILTRFWDQARKTFREELTFTRMEQEEIDDAISVISVSNSVEYAELVENERLQVADVVAAVAAAALTKSTANVTTEEGSWDTGPDVSTLSIEERAAKPKTRPSQTNSTPADRAASLEPRIDTYIDVADQQQISASPRALEMIRKMYPTSVEEALAKDTDWDLFVHAMNDLQFNARNVGGSGVAFEHPSKKKIIFHRPHPVAKIDNVMLQSMGKRLGKHFGWSRESFVGV